MKRILFSLVLLVMGTLGFAQTDFILKPTQSMLMTGKRPGQDATINPFEGEECFALVENIGERSFSVRIQFKDEIVEEVTVKKGETKSLKLKKDYQLYLDPNAQGVAKARVDYRKPPRASINRY
ncbi:hypothetical protein BST97_04860 [Nonlabens spongiae]|uniref:Uncharacterized protein n=2 Tax=Nonlabens spongiae TaxID=331648 RepID=A0A1W6MID6_9FLAO|nr:hypothetical protein BST97_04860 [Nonlabens spongiae]